MASDSWGTRGQRSTYPNKATVSKKFYRNNANAFSHKTLACGFLCPFPNGFPSFLKNEPNDFRPCRGWENEPLGASPRLCFCTDKANRTVGSVFAIDDGNRTLTRSG